MRSFQKVPYYAKHTYVTGLNQTVLPESYHPDSFKLTPKHFLSAESAGLSYRQREPVMGFKPVL